MQTVALQEKNRTAFTTSSNSNNQMGTATLPAVPIYQQKPIQKMELEEEQPMQAKLTTQFKTKITAAPPPIENNDNTNDGIAQLKELEEEMPLQGKFIVQKKELEDEMPMQSKFIAQRMELEEEQPIQGKFIIQRKELEEQIPIQPKFKIPSSAPTEQKPFQRFALPKSNEPEAVQTPIQRFVLPSQPIQKQANNTGLPDNLKAGVENLSGFSMDDVKVHYNSAKPAQLQAHAYAQGTDIHIGPGQEKHLPHEAWHVVQQKQGRVQATMQMKGGVMVNDDKGLEGEADVLGKVALQNKLSVSQLKLYQFQGSTVQRIIINFDVSRPSFWADGRSGEHSTNINKDALEQLRNSRHLYPSHIYRHVNNEAEESVAAGTNTIKNLKLHMAHHISDNNIQDLIVRSAINHNAVPRDTSLWNHVQAHINGIDPAQFNIPTLEIFYKASLTAYKTAQEILNYLLLFHTIPITATMANQLTMLASSIANSPMNLHLGDGQINSSLGNLDDPNNHPQQPLALNNHPLLRRKSLRSELMSNALIAYSRNGRTLDHARNMNLGSVANQQALFIDARVSGAQIFHNSASPSGFGQFV